MRGARRKALLTILIGVLTVLVVRSIHTYWVPYVKPYEEAMWETQTLSSGSVVSTDGAIAASRNVFLDENILGLTQEQLHDYLGGHKNAYIYRSPMFSVGEGVLTYRFDNGAWGIQYNIYLADDGRACRIERREIE